MVEAQDSCFYELGSNLTVQVNKFFFLDYTFYILINVTLSPALVTHCFITKIHQHNIEQVYVTHICFLLTVIPGHNRQRAALNYSSDKIAVSRRTKCPFTLIKCAG